MCVHLQLTENKSVKKNLTGIFNTGFHQLWLQVQRDKLRSFLLCATYRPPDFPTTCFMDDFRDKCLQALTHEKEIFVAGYLKCNTVKSSPESDVLKDLCLSLNLTQLITSAARETPQSSSSIYDIMTSNNASIGEFNKVFS